MTPGEREEEREDKKEKREKYLLTATVLIFLQMSEKNNLRIICGIKLQIIQ